MSDRIFATLNIRLGWVVMVVNVIMIFRARATGGLGRRRTRGTSKDDYHQSDGHKKDTDWRGGRGTKDWSHSG